jgi:hypothetical protein
VVRRARRRLRNAGIVAVPAFELERSQRPRCDGELVLDQSGRWPSHRKRTTADRMKIAAHLDHGAAFLDGIDALGDDLHAHVVTQRRRHAHQSLLHRALVDPTYKGHVELDELWFERGKAREPCVGGSEVIDCDPVVDLTGALDSPTNQSVPTWTILRFDRHEHAGMK